MSKSTRLIILLLLSLGLVVLAACSNNEEEAEPTEAPAEAAPDSGEDAGESGAETGETGDSAEAGGDWAAIQEEGVLVVGTAADYPPFAYYDDEFALTGFDIDLAQAIGEQLGVDIQFEDMAFDGLGQALQIGQIDVAIAAITVTPERDRLVDFSDPYFLSSGALVAKTDANIPEITTAEQLAAYRVGVQTATVYQDWAQETLVDAGIMPQENLFVYRVLDTAGADLIADRIDVVAFDLIPAELAIEENAELEIIGSELNRQQLAVAAQDGQSELVAQINAALDEIKASGQLESLVETYIGPIEDHLPLEDDDQAADGETEESDNEEAEEAEDTDDANRGGGEFVCYNGMEFVQDLNLDDNNMENPPVMQPGQAFQKGWRVRNVGTCTWDTSYSLNFASGNVPGAQMGGSAVPVQTNVAPGGTYDFWVNLVAPTAAGTYQGFWEMRDGEGAAFGARAWVGITVGQQPTPTPLPTQTPIPGISFTADRTQINQGECATLNWSTENVQAVYLYEQGQTWQDHGVVGSGTRQVCPQQTTVYELRVVKQDGSVEIRQIQINVTPVVNAPVINQFSVDPSKQEIGQCVRLVWNVSGSVSRVQIQRSGTVLWDNAPLAATYDDCVNDPGTFEYVVEASGPGGTSRQVQSAEFIRPTPIVNTSWRLTNYRSDSGLASVLPGTTVTANFGSDFRVTGSGGCNSYNATYTASANNIRIGSLSSTGQTCGSPEGIMSQEAAVFNLMQQALLYRIEGSTLYITDGQNNTLLQYTRQ